MHKTTAQSLLPELYGNLHPWLEPFLRSSLAVTTILAIVLNLVFRVGIARREVQTLECGVNSSDRIFHFMENQERCRGCRRTT